MKKKIDIKMWTMQIIAHFCVFNSIISCRIQDYLYWILAIIKLQNNVHVKQKCKWSATNKEEKKY